MPSNQNQQVAFQPQAVGELTSGVLVALFICSTIIPASFQIGGLNLSFSRVYLILVFFPLLFQLLSRRAGKIVAADYFFTLYAFWILVTLLYHHGMARFALSGVTIVEHFGAYLVGRVLIRNAADYRNFIKIFFVSLIILFPFALIELNTNINLWSKFWGLAFDIPHKPRSAYGRIGLNRVMSGFDHPIHFGLYCALGVANIFYIYKRKLAVALPMLCFVTFMSFMSLSSAPLLAIGLQAIMILWDLVMRGRWKLFVILVALAYVAVDLSSNRTPVTILISTLTFNAGTAWIRVSIWTYGIAAVWSHPIMGIGLNDWPRPFWLTSSVDNFWLLTMMRHGIVGLVFLILGIGSGFIGILRSKNLGEDVSRYRTGYILAFLALLFSLSTVHIWGATGSFVMFYFGAGLWLCNAGGSSEVGSRVDQDMTKGDGRRDTRLSRSRGLPPTRFPQSHRRGQG